MKWCGPSTPRSATRTGPPFLPESPCGRGISVRLEMRRDTFETDDQRNRTDASFKTYCTPLALPLPHSVKQGARVRQSVTLRLTGNVRPIQPVQVGRPPQLSIATTPALAP